MPKALSGRMLSLVYFDEASPFLELLQQHQPFLFSICTVIAYRFAVQSIDVCYGFDDVHGMNSFHSSCNVFSSINLLKLFQISNLISVDRINPDPSSFSGRYAASETGISEHS